MLKTNKILIFLFIFSLVHAQDIKLEETWDGYEGEFITQLDIQTEGALKVENYSGDVYVEGTDDTEFYCTEIFTIKSRSRSRARSIFKKNRVRIEEKDDRIIIEGSNPGRIYYSRLEIRIPQKYFANVISEGGDITAVNLTGSFTGTSQGGDLDCSEIRGELSLQTLGGDISVDNANGNITVKTSGGDVDLEAIESEVKIRTAGGDIDLYRFKGQGSIKTSGGDINLQALEGEELSVMTSGGNISINNSNINLNARTFGGDIRLSKASKNYDLDTKGGDIFVEEVEGDLKTKTSGGDVEVGHLTGTLFVKSSGGDVIIQTVRNDVEVINSGGDITIEQANGNVDIKGAGGDIYIRKLNNKDPEQNNVAISSSGGKINCHIDKSISAILKAQIQMKHYQDYDLISDFDLEIKSEKVRNKYVIRGNAYINGGKSLIDLRNDEGDIKIKAINNK